MEPPIVEREQVDYVEGGESWYHARLPLLEGRIRTRFDQLAKRLGQADWLDGQFSAGDLMMVMVLRRAESMDILEDYPTLRDYMARGEARPAYERAFADQLSVFEGAAV